MQQAHDEAKHQYITVNWRTTLHALCVQQCFMSRAAAYNERVFGTARCNTKQNTSALLSLTYLYILCLALLLTLYITGAALCALFKMVMA